MVTLTRFFGKHSHLHVSPIKSNKGHTFHVIKSQNQTIRLLLFIFYHTIRVLKKYLLIINQTEREKETREKEKLEREREREREIIFVLHRLLLIHHRLSSSPPPTTCSPDGSVLRTALKKKKKCFDF